MSDEVDADRDEPQDSTDADAAGAAGAETADGAAADTADTTDGGAGEGAALAAAVAEHDEALAAEVAALERRAVEAEERVDELESRIRRTKADFQNYKKRAKKRQEQQRARATEDLVGRLTEVRDNLVRALDQEEGADLRPGVESTLETFDRALEEVDVSVIDPEPGEPVDPERHEVMMRVDSDRPEGTVADVFKQGYETDERVIEAAQVTVSDDE